MSDLSHNDTPAGQILRQMPTVADRFDLDEIEAAQHLLRVSKRLLIHFNAAFEQRGLSPGRYSILMTLHAEDGPMPPSELALRVGVSKPTVTGIVAVLMRDGFVHQVSPDTTDRRRRAIALTDAGKEKLKEVVPDIFEMMTGLLDPLSKTERRSLVENLGRIETHLRGLDAREPNKDRSHDRT
ncbi:MAG: MarR family winged helix-turn-helix transcriptional regulator [Pseudooceanicola sp.]